MRKIDSFTVTQYLKMYGGRIMLGSLGVGIVAGYEHGWFFFILSMLIGLLVPIPAICFIDKVSGVLMYFYNGSSGTFSLDEQLAAEVEKIKILQSKQKFSRALKTANAVLARNPEHPETLYLKAQILSGFEKYCAANTCLNKLIAMKNPVPDKTLRNWAITQHKENLERIREQAERNGSMQES
jgi:hypothetical protein